MRWSSVVLILLAIQFSNCDPLTNAENEQRLNSCGKKVQSKVYMGRDAKQSEAPWSIFYLLYGKPDAKGTRTATTCTGTIVSTRHILFATHCFADLNGVSWAPKDLPFDNNNCKGNHYEITNEELLKAVKIQSNGAKVAQHPEKITIVNGCIKRQANKTTQYANIGPQLYADDFAIIDLYEDLTFSETLGMVCVAESRAANAVNTVLDYFGFGLNPPKGQQEGKDNSGQLRHEKINIIDKLMEDYYFMARSVDSKTIACVGDSGGGSIGDINGRKTIVGVLSQTNCAQPDKRDNDPFEQYASVGYYNDIICQLTGICNTSQEHDKYLPNNVRPVKPTRPTEAPIVQHQREIGQPQGAVEPDGANEKSIHFIVALVLSVFFF
ncbi:hypothetical protein B9Z55_002514 [Caenorhabditis nigoni]|uniref:Peptidase S1 domain-containing protein n=1 Tax=Caenorhabditis nigoni TaxID=1611254 RepID=A0A2G5VKS3_9PELO|nr:hypothetical protein B9Z55_002514 [Caenorhabditis nigoni]